MDRCQCVCYTWQVVEAAGGTRLPARPKTPVFREAQKHVRSRLEKKWLAEFITTPEYLSRHGVECDELISDAEITNPTSASVKHQVKCDLGEISSVYAHILCPSMQIFITCPWGLGLGIRLHGISSIIRQPRINAAIE